MEISTSQILLDFEKSKSVHPRLMASREHFDKIKSRLNTEPVKTWVADLLKRADAMLEEPVVSYIKDAGGTMLLESRKVLNNTLNLSLAYIFTQDKSYADRLGAELEAACNFPDWNSTVHFLDTAEMTTAIAIGYDWLYDYWSSEQRELMQNSIMEKGLKEGEKCYNGQEGVSGMWVKWNWNWNQVCNGGLSVGALAIMECAPEFCAWILQQAFSSLECMICEFAPDGAWKEGAMYWDYTTKYMAFHIASLNSVLGSSYDYFNRNHIDQTGYFPIYSSSAQGAFNFHDSVQRYINAPQLFLFAEIFNESNLARLRLADMEMHNAASSALDILWFNPECLNSDDSLENLSLDRYFKRVELATFRSAWNDKNAIFVGIHGGENNVAHGALDSGTFVLDAFGYRWISHLGPDSYTLPGYFEEQRFTYYRCGAQGQNTIALNPISEFGQEPTAFTAIEHFETDKDGGYAVVNMQPAFGDKVSNAKRSIHLHDNRSVVIVRDELMLTRPADFWWFAHTKAEISLSEDKKSAVLTIENKKMRVLLESNISSAKFQVIDAAPLPGSPNPLGQMNNDEFRVLAINIADANKEVIVSVAFTA